MRMGRSITGPIPSSSNWKPRDKHKPSVYDLSDLYNKENAKVRGEAQRKSGGVARPKPRPVNNGLSSTSTTMTATATATATTAANANANAAAAMNKSSGSSNSNAAASSSTKVSSKPKFQPMKVKVNGKVFTTRPAFDTFWEYTSERHAVEVRRRAGRLAPWSKKSVFREYKFCSVFRVSDRGSQFLIKEVIEKGSQEEEELLFRVLLYSSFVRIETYKLLSKSLGPLSWKTYDHSKYSEVLTEAIYNGDSIYTGAFQKFPPQLGYSAAHENHLALLEIMMSNNLLGQLKACKYMADAFDVIYQFPGSGDFVAFQLLINLSYTPLVNFGENDFVIAGVGAVKGLNKCFAPSDLVNGVSGSEGELIRWMTDTQNSHFERLGLEPAVLSDGSENLKRKMSLVDVEHTLCELQKYLRIISGSSNGSGHGKRFTQRSSRLPRWPSLPLAWDDPSRSTTKRKFGRPGNVRAEKVYVVNRILDRGETEDGEEVYFVDWLGYPASARTWEPREVLLDDAPLAVEEFERREMEIEDEDENGNVGKGSTSSNSNSKKRKRE